MKTPEEIKKALKACTMDGCWSCPFQNCGADCIELLCMNALNLINLLEEPPKEA